MTHNQVIDVHTAYVDRMRSCLEYTEAEFTTSESDFCQRYLAYTNTRHLDALRTNQHNRLDTLKHVYLDYTGGGLYAQSQIERNLHQLTDRITS